MCPVGRGNNGFVTGSRDKTLKVWKRRGQICFEEEGDLEGHTDFVSAVCCYDDDDDGGGGGGGVDVDMSAVEGMVNGKSRIVSGSRDATVMVWEKNEEEMWCSVHRLEGHEYQVTGVAVLDNGDIVSASLDKTLRVWSGNACKAVVQGHEGPVLCVAKLPDGHVASGSGDCTIRMWDLQTGGGVCTLVLEGHTDTVRSVASVPGIGLVSGSHDMTLKLWTLDGECVASMEGHEALVYSVAVHPSGQVIASGSEDNTARLWNLQGKCLQVISHPGCVWATCFLSNGDLITACADGTARVWTQDETRKAAKETVEMYNASMAEFRDRATKQDQNSENASEDIPMQPSSVLESPGSHDGQTVVVKEGAAAMAYCWNQSEATWEKMGEVIRPPGVSAANHQYPDGEHNPHAWDFVFDVDVADGVPPLKIKANTGDNAYEIADNFIAENNLPTSYREQIVSFLLQNSHGRLRSGISTQAADPYTGSSAYVPPTTDMPVIQQSSTSVNVDPLTGVTRNDELSRFIPVRKYQHALSSISPENLRKKLFEFNSVWSNSPEEDKRALALTPNDWNQLDSLLENVRNVSKANDYKGEQFVEKTLPSVTWKMMQWSLDMVYPLLDIIRLLAMVPGGAEVVASQYNTLGSNTEGDSFGAIIDGIFTADANLDASKITALRCLNNAFQPLLMGCIIENITYFLRILNSCSTSHAKGIQNGYTTFLLNLAVFQGKSAAAQASSNALICLCAKEFLRTHKDDHTNMAAKMNALLAIGTLLIDHRELTKSALKDALLQDSILEGIVSTQQGNAEASTVAKGIISMLRNPT